jgi:hypothetical protein
MCVAMPGVACAAANDDRGVTLLVQGASPISNTKGAEATWGEYEVGPDNQLCWSGFAGYLVHRHGWKLGGIFRPVGEQVLPQHLDTMGAYQDGPADFYMLASSVSAQDDGLISRARELASAVDAVCAMTGAKAVRCICYSASGVAARFWMQGAIDGLGYDGQVSHLVTLATPHAGIAGLARPVSKLWKRYETLDVEGEWLRKINRELDLPQDCRFTSIVLQSPGLTIGDSGNAYLRFLRFPQEQIDALPPLLRNGHDGVVHTLSAQLHLTPTAARYENATDRPVEVVVCRPQQMQLEDANDLTLHTRAVGDETVWRALMCAMQTRSAARLDDEQRLMEQRRWATQIALHMAETTVRREQLATRITSSAVLGVEHTQLGRQCSRITWRCRVRCESWRLFAKPELGEYEVRGRLEVVFDRFQRPMMLRAASAETSQP